MITPMAGGAGAPELADGLANLQDRTFDFIINPYTDTASLDAIKDFLLTAPGAGVIASSCTATVLLRNLAPMVS